MREGLALGDYGYINARIRGMKSRLLSPSDYEKLLQEKDLEGLKTKLKETEYSQDIEKIEGLYPDLISQLNHGLMENLSRTTEKLKSIIGGEAKKFLEVLLARWDVFNLKTLLRGKIKGVPTEEIELSILPAGILTPLRLRELAKEDDPQIIMDKLATWGLKLPVVLTRELNKLVWERKIEAVEHLLDTMFFDWAFSQLRSNQSNDSLVFEILSKLVDTRNVIACLVLIRNQIKPLGRISLIPRGCLTRSVLDNLMNTDNYQEAIKLLQETYLGKYLRDKELKSPYYLERTLENLIVKEAYSQRLRDPLGIGILTSYLFLKETEIINLRVIIYGVNYNVPKHEIREELVLLA